MKYIKRLLASVIAAAMTVSLAVPPVLAAPEGSERPSIANPTASGYKGGIGEVNWGDTDWGAFGDIDFDGAMDKTADELAALFDGTEVNVINTDSTLTFDAEEGAFYTDAEAEVNLDALDYSAGEINFPEGDTVIISSAEENALYLKGETTINIPDNSSVLIINTYKTTENGDDGERSSASCVKGDTVNINTNESGNLAALGFDSGAWVSCGIRTEKLSVSGTGVVAALGGRANQSIGVYAVYSIGAKGASLIGAGASYETYAPDIEGGNFGIMITYAEHQEDGLTGYGVLSAEDNALVIGAGGGSPMYSRGIFTVDIEARDHSEIYAYGGSGPEENDLWDSIGIIPCILGARSSVITADNGSKIIAGGVGDYGFGIFEDYYTTPEDPDIEFEKTGSVRFSLDESEGAEPSEIYLFGSYKAYFQANVKENTPGGNVKILGSDELNNSFTNVVEFDETECTYTYNGQIAKIVQITKGETADYTLYYNPADSSFYKDYDVLEGVYSDKVDSVPGASGDGSNLTLTSDFKFYTSADVGLALPEFTNIIVPEGEDPEIIAGSLTDGTATAGITSFSGCYMSINGTLYVSGGYGNNKNSYGIFGYDSVFISGNGSMVCSGGSVNVDNGDSYYSIGIYTPSVLSVSKTMVIADGGRIFADDENSKGESIGILTGSLEGSPDEDEEYNGVSVSEQAYVLASGNGGSGNVFSYGCITSSVWVNGDSDFMLNTYGNSKSAIGLGILLDKYAEVIVGDNGWIGASAEGGETVSYGMSEVIHDDAEFDGTKQITLSLSGNGSIHLWGETQAVCATKRPFGNVKVTDGTDELTFSEDECGYVNSDGTPAIEVQIEAVPAADYTIYYSQEAGFRKNNAEGEQLTADTLPEGMSAEGDTITLDNVEFITSASAALMTEGSVVINIPQNSRAGLMATAGDSEGDESKDVCGIKLLNGGNIHADGFLGVQAEGLGKSVGIESTGRLVINGSGNVIAREMFGDDGSCALASNDQIAILGTVHVDAEAISVTEEPKNVSGTISRDLYVFGGAVLDTSGGMDSSAITISDGGRLYSTDDASIIADGGVVIHESEDGEPGEIRATGESSIEVICDHEGDGDSVLDWGIYGIPSEGSAASGIASAIIDVWDGAKITVTSPAEAENGGAVYGAAAVERVNAVGGKTAEDSGALEYKDGKYVISGTDETAKYIQFTSVEEEPVDYAIYYDADAGFRKNSADGDPLAADELPEGMSAEGDTVTLDNTAIFPDAPVGLVVGDGVTVYVPENSESDILGSNIPANNNDADNDHVYGLQFLGDGTLQVDGTLVVDSISTQNYTRSITSDGNLTIKGKGEITASAYGGAVNTCGIYCDNLLNIEDSVYVNAYAYVYDTVEEPACGVVCGYAVIVRDSAVLDTTGGDNARGIKMLNGGVILTYDTASINANGGIDMFGNEQWNPGQIRANDESTIASVCVENEHGIVFDWAIQAVPYGDTSGYSRVYAAEGAKIVAYSPSETGGAVNKVIPISNSVKVTGGNSADDTDELQLSGATYVIPGTENTAKYAMFTGVEEVLPDYAIYYDAEAGFRKNKPDGDPLAADELPEGISADGNTLTLKNFVFSTTASVALAVGDGVTVSVPEEDNAFISCHGGDEGYGLEFLGNGVLRVDGYLYVSASGSEAYGIAAFGDLAITGAGELSADEYSDSDTAYVLFSTDNITVDGSIKVYANAYSLKDAPKYVYSVICRQLNVKDSASLESWGENSSAIVIWDGGDIIVEDSASITAYGGIILFGNEEKKPGAIRASGDSTVTVVCKHEGEGTEESENVLDWGITGAPDRENASADAIADIIVTDNATVSVSVAAENGGAVYKAKAAKGVIVTGGNSADESAALEYKDDKYVFPGTDDAANYIMFKGGKTEPADYTICYSVETGFRKDGFSGDPITADELPEGMSADGDTLTLDNVEFITTSPIALAVGDGVTIYVPENTSSTISAVSDNSDEKYVYGMEIDGNSVIRADGSLLVSAEGADLAIGIGTWGDLTIEGDGEVTAEERGLSKTSYALLCTDNLVIKDSVQVYADAYAPDGPSELTVGVICRQLNVKDDAYLDTTGGEDAMGIWIWDGYDIVAEDNARINAYGGVIMEGEKDIDPGAIRASGESIIMVVSFREGDGNSVLHWGICGIRSDNPALIYVNDNARVLAYSIEENGGAVTTVKAADGVSAIGGNSADESDALEYKDETYVIAGTDDTANYIVFRSAHTDAYDHPLYFDGETGKLYKTFDYEFGEDDVTFSDPVEVPGAICEKNKLTLTSEFQFYTTYEDGLVLGEGTTLYVPEGESPSVHSAVSGLVLNENTGGTSGITCLGNNTLNIDGSLSVTAGDGVNIDSWGITDAGVGKNMDITGKGSLTVYGGNITYDETVPEDRPRGVSCAIGAYDDINVSIAELNAIGGNAYNGSFGIVADYPDTEPHTLTVSGGSHVTARGGRCDNEEMCLSVGGAANHLVIRDNSSVTLYAPGAGERYYAIGLLVYNNNENYGEGKIELSKNSTLTVKAGDTSSSCGIVPSGELEPISAKTDSSCTFTAEGAYKASIIEVKGVSAVSDGKTVKYDSEQASYVDEDGNPVTQISFESLAADATKAPSTGGGGGGGFKPSSGTKPTEKPSATTEPTSAPSETANPETSTAPSATTEPEPTNAPSTDNFPFVDVNPTDWFYNSVKAAYTEGLISGVTETEFAPNMTLTRGMLVTIIGRAGAAEASASPSFTDVDANAYYAPYIAWAAENGIVSGLGDGTFRPDETVTREQTAAILWRYMKYIGADVSAGNIPSFTDASDISEYAVPTIQWACGAGVINGYPDGSLAPKSGITRAEFTVMISKIALY